MAAAFLQNAYEKLSRIDRLASFVQIRFSELRLKATSINGGGSRKYTLIY